VETLATGNWPSETEPESSRFPATGSSTSEVIPAPGINVENAMPSPAGVSLVRNPVVEPRDCVAKTFGTSAATVG
jgi:hypothetical protein